MSEKFLRGMEIFFGAGAILLRNLVNFLAETVYLRILLFYNALVLGCDFRTAAKVLKKC